MSSSTLMQNLYDYFYDTFIGKDSDNLKLQMLPLGIAINPDDFKDPLSPANFDEGAYETAENFATMVNDIPEAQVRFVSKGKLQDVYKWILNNAVPITVGGLSPELKEAYERSVSLLNVTVDGKTMNSDRYTAYLDAKAKYEKALYNRNAKSLAADRSTPKGKRLWLNEKSMLDMDVDNAYNNYRQYDDIENALNIVQTAYAKGLTEVLAEENKYFSQSELESDSGRKWHLCNAFPSNWYESDSMYTAITVDQTRKREDSESQYLKLGVDMTFKAGCFSASGDSTHTQSSKEYSKNTEVTSLELEVAAVRIDRPWLNETLFSLDGWKIQGYSKAHISDGTFMSNGKKNEGLMPLISKYMLIVRNVKLKGSFDSELVRDSKQDTEVNASVGIGPFKVNGHTQFGKESHKLDTEANESSITIRTPQIIGFISSVVPLAPKNE